MKITIKYLDEDRKTFQPPACDLHDLPFVNVIAKIIPKLTSKFVKRPIILPVCDNRYVVWTYSGPMFQIEFIDGVIGGLAKVTSYKPVEGKAYDKHGSEIREQAVFVFGESRAEGFDRSLVA